MLSGNPPGAPKRDSALGGEVYILRGGAVGPTSLDVTVAGDGRFGHSID